jgi:hypothetical protein
MIMRNNISHTAMPPHRIIKCMVAIRGRATQASTYPWTFGKRNRSLRKDVNILITTIKNI